MRTTKIWFVTGDAMRTVRNGLHSEPLEAYVSAQSIETAIEAFKAYAHRMYSDTDHVETANATLRISTVWYDA